MTGGSWEAGEVVVWSDARRDRMHGASPVAVVEDTDECSVTYVAEGTRFRFPPGGLLFDDERSWTVPDELPANWRPPE